MTEEFQPTTCVLCNTHGESRDIGNCEKEYQCPQNHHYIITFKADKLLHGVGMAQSRQGCIVKLATVPPGEILFIRTPSTEEKKAEPSLGLVAETRTYRV